MSKRRLNQQQQNRIKKNQANLQHPLGNEDPTASHPGLVIARFGRHAEIESQDGLRVHCAIRPNLEALVVGDQIRWIPLETGRGVVVSLCPRLSLLSRTDKRLSTKALAANVTQLVIVLAAKPEPSFSLLDSYLIMAECLQLKTCIVLNKTDLEHKASLQQLLSDYQPLGYPILGCSQKNSLGFEALESTLIDQSSVFVGQSGVGKSSLIAALLPHETQIQTADISAASELGCHTTSHSRLYHLPKGGALIDSPGIREWGLWQMPIDDIYYGFREFRDLKSSCKFRNCNHEDSPGCALIQAVNQGLISENRYHSFLKLAKEWVLYKKCAPRP